MGLFGAYTALKGQKRDQCHFINADSTRLLYRLQSQNMGNSKLPRITVVTPSYNQGKFLEETILSVINQDYPNLEYFIVDGGSTDNSIDIIKKYEHKIDWWVSEKDGGQSEAIRKGFARATGALLCWLNSDDVYFPNALRGIGEAYLKRPWAAMYVGGIAIGEKGDRGIKKCSIPTKPLRMFTRYGIAGFGQQSSFFNAEHYRKIGGVNTRLYIRMDGDLSYRLLGKNPNVVVIKKMIGFFRWHESTKSTVSVHRYLQERNEFVGSLGISIARFRVHNILFKLYRMLSGGYYESWGVTRRFRGKRMSEIWLNGKKPLDTRQS